MCTAVPTLTNVCYSYLNNFPLEFNVTEKFELAICVHMCELLNCGHALFSMTSIAWSDQLVPLIMESTKVNKVCYCSIRSHQSIVYTLYKVRVVQVYF